MTALASAPRALPAAGVVRRLASLVYEGVLLFGIVMIAGLLFGTMAGQRHALESRHGLQAVVFVVLGVYFSWFWSGGRQTIAMKAWHLRITRRDGSPLTARLAMARYLLGWLWVLPALVAASIWGTASSGTVTLMVAGWMAAYALLAGALPQRQWLHDTLSGTRMVLEPPAATGARPVKAPPA